MTTYVLITGTTRGLGKIFATRFLAQPNHVVIALNRDPSDPKSKSLSELPTADGSKLIVVKCDSSVDSDPFDAVKELEKQGVDHLDIVIANAAITTGFPWVRDAKPDDMKKCFAPNVCGVVSLYQATRGLLEKSSNPKFVTMGSTAGWLEEQHPAPNAVYGPSKAAVHWISKRIDGEEERIASFCAEPGWNRTDMGNAGATAYGFECAPLDPEESVAGLMKLISEATKKTHGGKFWSQELKKLTW